MMKGDYLTVYGFWTAGALLFAFLYPSLGVWYAVIAFTLIYGIILTISWLIWKEE